jgi:hypothetical protein
MRRHEGQPRSGRRAGNAGRKDRHHSLVGRHRNLHRQRAAAGATVSRVVIDEEEGRIEVVVPDDQLSLAIGRRGQNVRLASQLTGRGIDIMTEAGIEREAAEGICRALRNVPAGAGRR